MEIGFDTKKGIANLFHAFGNNPIKYVDPDGRADWKPLTYKALWNLAFKTSKLKQGNQVYNNQKVGAAFEKAVGQAFGFANKNTYEFHSSVRSESLIPDFVGIVNVLGISSSGETEIVDVYGTGLFIEAKTTKKIGLDGSTKLQMKSMVDACANQISMAGSRSGANGVAALYLVTPADSKIYPELIKYAT